MCPIFFKFAPRRSPSMEAAGKSPSRDANGWDGKLRHPKAEEASNADDAASPPESDNEEGTVQQGEIQTLEGYEIDADEGAYDKMLWPITC